MRPAVWILIAASLITCGWMLVKPHPSSALAQPLDTAPPASSSQTLEATTEPQTEPCASLETEPLQLKLPSDVGRVGVFAMRYRKTPEGYVFKKAVGHNSQQVFPLASAYKTSILLEVLQQADQGTLSFKERFNVTKGNQSLGQYPYDNSTVLDLALRMIKYSDNTATDILHHRVGLGALQHLATDNRLCHTKLLLPTKAWWVAEAGLGGKHFPKTKLFSSVEHFNNAPQEERVAIAQDLYTQAQRYSAYQLNNALVPYWEGRYSWQKMATLERGLQNSSTPMEWAQLLWYGFQGEGLSDSSQQVFRKIMSHGYGQSLVWGIAHKYYGGKNGNTAGVLAFTGYLEDAKGITVYSYLSDTVPHIYTPTVQRKAAKIVQTAIKAL